MVGLVTVAEGPIGDTRPHSASTLRRADLPCKPQQPSMLPCSRGAFESTITMLVVILEL